MAAHRIFKRCLSILTWVTVSVVASVEARAAEQKSTVIESVNISGNVQNFREIRVKFREPAVNLGDTQATAPFTVKCPKDGTPSWDSPKIWKYTLPEESVAGTTCTLRVNPNFKTIKNLTIDGPSSYTVQSNGPIPVRYIPNSEIITEDQEFIFVINGNADEESILKHVYFLSSQLPAQPIAIRLLPKSRVQTIIAGLDSYEAQPFKEAPNKGHSVIGISAKQRFPALSQVNLIWGSGVKSANGAPSGHKMVREFRVRAPFRVEVSCTRAQTNAPCSPHHGVNVSFSSPVSLALARKIKLRDTSGKEYLSELAKDLASGSKQERFEGKELTETGLSFLGPLNPNSKIILSIPEDLKDDEGRSPQNYKSFPIALTTSTYGPIAKFATAKTSGSFGLVEWNSDPGKSLLPISVRDVESDIPARVVRVTPQIDVKRGFFSKIAALFKSGQDIPKLKFSDIYDVVHQVSQYYDRANSILPKLGLQSSLSKQFTIKSSKTFEVVGIPFDAPGLYVVELESKILGSALLEKQSPMYVQTSVLVTNLAIHLQYGVDSALAWVTSLDTGKPVGGAFVTVADPKGAIIWQGNTDKNGIARINQINLKRLANDLQSNYKEGNYLGLIITAQTSEDMSFVFSSWDEGLEPWRFNINTTYTNFDNPVIATTALDRSLFRPGETVSMKHLVRYAKSQGLLLPDIKKLSSTIDITHLQTGQIIKTSVDWDKNGSGLSTWQIPKEAKRGTYSITLFNDEFGNKQSATAGNAITTSSFRVEDYKIPLTRGQIILPNKSPIVTGGAKDSVKSLDVNVQVQYLAGGSAARLPVKLLYQTVDSYAPAPEGYSDYSFTRSNITAGVHRSSEQDYSAQNELKPMSKELNLDARGSGTFKIELPKIKNSNAKSLVLELEYRDPSGTVQTVSRWTPIYSSHLKLGINIDPYDPESKKPREVKVVALDLNDQPAQNVLINVTAFKEKYYSHRKRLAGGIYGYERAHEYVPTPTNCHGKTNSSGVLICGADFLKTGFYSVVANAEDLDGIQTNSYTNASGQLKDQWWHGFGNHASDRMTLSFDKSSYKTDETAELKVDLPFESAYSLVSIQREGILDAWVTQIKGNHPKIDIPMKPAYAPNAFVSVLGVRGRSADVPPTSMVDLGKPSFRLGLREFKVGTEANELRVEVTPDKKSFKTRDQVSAQIRITTANGLPLKEGTEIAVAVVDEGLLDLSNNRTWDIFSEFMRYHGNSVQSATTMGRVIGKRHFGQKAMPTGGDGGSGGKGTREIFDSLLTWQPRVKVGKNGVANVSFKANDSITSFVIAAIATSGPDLFGTGKSSFTVNQDLAIYSGLPTTGRIGDSFKPIITIRNGTDHPMTIAVDGRVWNTSGNARKELLTKLASQNITIPKQESRDIAFEYVIPSNISKLSYEFNAQSSTGETDSLTVSQEVSPQFTPSVIAATLVRVDKGNPTTIPVAPSSLALPGSSDISVKLAKSLVGGLDAIEYYMNLYPYSCLEQQISKAISLNDKSELAKIAAKLPLYVDERGLLKYFDRMADGSVVLTSYVLNISKTYGWDLPAEVKKRLIDALRNALLGSIVTNESKILRTWLDIRILALEALSVNSATDSKIWQTFTVSPNHLDRQNLISWYRANIHDSSRAGKHQDAALNAVKSQLRSSGTTMSFGSSSENDYFYWIMSSDQEQTARLLLAAMEDSKSWSADIPLLIRGSLGSLQAGRISLTTGNTWFKVAMNVFSNKYETTPVSGQTKATLENVASSVSHQWKDADREALLSLRPVEFTKPDNLALSHEGSGGVWAEVQNRGALQLRTGLAKGYSIVRKTIPIARKSKDRWSAGDLMRVRLEFTSTGLMDWVVVDDPIPSGATIIGGVNASAMMSNAATPASEQSKFKCLSPDFFERTFKGARSYFRTLDQGSWCVEYTVRLNTPGRFKLSNTRVEAMYAPEMYGEIPNDDIAIE